MLVHDSNHNGFSDRSNLLGTVSYDGLSSSAAPSIWACKHVPASIDTGTPIARHQDVNFGLVKVNFALVELDFGLVKVDLGLVETNFGLVD